MATEAAKDAQAVASAATNVAVLPGSETVAKPSSVAPFSVFPITGPPMWKDKRIAVLPLLVAVPVSLALLTVGYRHWKRK